MKEIEILREGQRVVLCLLTADVRYRVMDGRTVGDREGMSIRVRRAGGSSVCLDVTLSWFCVSFAARQRDMYGLTVSLCIHVILRLLLFPRLGMFPTLYAAVTLGSLVIHIVSACVFIDAKWPYFSVHRFTHPHVNAYKGDGI